MNKYSLFFDRKPKIFFEKKDLTKELCRTEKIKV